MNDFFNSLLEKIDVYIVVIVLCAGFFQSRYFKGFQISKDPSYDSALKTLGLSAIASTVYILLARDPNSATNWAKYFISYFAATSLYELLISHLVDWIKTKTGVDIKGADK
jgi:hypothetical protein